MGTPTLTRPQKVGNVRTYVDEVNYLAPADAPILAPEVDADLDTIYTAWNNPASAFPPTGAAGGDLAGSTYPGPVIAPGVVTAAKLAAGVIPATLPPSGAAGGDLAGSSYPNPTIAKLAGAAVGPTTPLARGDLLVANGTPALTRLPLGAANTVLQSNGSDALWGASLGGPPTGAAGGDLAGSSYPNPVIQAGAVTPAKLAAGATVQGAGVTATFPTSWSTGTTGAFLTVLTLPVLNTRGGWVLFTGGPGAFLVGTAGGVTLYVQLARNGASIVVWRYDAQGNSSGNVKVIVPPVSWMDNPAAGAWTYAYQIMQTVGATFSTAGDNAASLRAVELS